MKLLSGLFLLINLGQTAMASVPYKAQCLSAAGYYGNIRIMESEDGELIQVTGEQGFGFQISRPLGLDASTIEVSLKKEDCKFSADNSKVISCDGQSVPVNFTYFGHPVKEELAFNVKFQLKEVLNNNDESTFPVSLSVSLASEDEHLLTGKAELNFGGPSMGSYGTCTF